MQELESFDHCAPVVRYTHQRLDNLFRILDPNCERLRNELEKYWQFLVREHTYLAASLSHRELQPRIAETVTELAAVTSSERKQHIIGRLAQEAGFTALFVAPLWDESDIHRRERYNPRFPSQYALNVAEAKQRADPIKIPTLTTDTVVMDRLPLEKPKSRNEAVEMIRSLSESEIQVCTGINLDTPTKSGRTISVGGEISVRLHITAVDRESVAAYVDTAPHVLDVSGGVDFSDPFARRLFLDPMKDATLTYSSLWSYGQIEVHPAGIGALDTYFFGAPKHLLRALFDLIQQIYSQL